MLGGDVGLPQAATGALDFKWTNCRNNVPTLTTANAKSRSRTRECVRITNRREPEKVVYVATAVELRSGRWQGCVPISAGTETSRSSRSSEVAISWCGRPPGIITLSPTPNRSLRPPANSRSTQPLRM